MKKCCWIDVNGNNDNNILVKPLTQKDSVEISRESINNNDLTKNNACEKRAIATNTTEISKEHTRYTK